MTIEVKICPSCPHICRYDNGKLYARQKSPHICSSLQHIPYAVHLLRVLNPFKKQEDGQPKYLHWVKRPYSLVHALGMDTIKD